VQKNSPTTDIYNLIKDKGFGHDGNDGRLYRSGIS